MTLYKTIRPAVMLNKVVDAGRRASFLRRHGDSWVIGYDYWYNRWSLALTRRRDEAIHLSSPLQGMMDCHGRFAASQ